MDEVEVDPGEGVRLKSKVRIYNLTCVKTLMKVDETEKVCQNRSIWSDVVSAYPSSEKV